MHKKRMVFISLTSVISVVFIVLTVCCFRTSYLRFFESVIDLGRSVKYFFCELFRIENTTLVSVIELSKEVSMIELDVRKEWEGKSLLELDLRKKYGINVMAIRIGDEVSIDIDPNQKLDKEMNLIIVADTNKIKKLK